MIKEAIDYILNRTAAKTFDLKDTIHGIDATFADKGLVQVIAKAPEQPAYVEVFTLEALADLVRTKLEDKDFAKDFFIHVENVGRVSLKSRASDAFGRRLVLAVAEPMDFERFPFDRWMNQEEFVIALAARFANTPDLAYVLSMASSLTNDASTTSEDDGISQKVNIKAGLRLKSETTLKSRVALAPYRIFPEVEQPVSEFVFRARVDGENTPMLKLVEADGGKWQVDAVQTIKKDIETHELGIPVIA